VASCAGLRFKPAARGKGYYGAPIGAILGEIFWGKTFAIGRAPAGSTGNNLSVCCVAITKLLGWRMRRAGLAATRSSPPRRASRSSADVLAQEQREALRRVLWSASRAVAGE